MFCTALASYRMSIFVLYMNPSSASVRIVLGPLWFSSARPLVKTLKRTDESGDPCGGPIVSWFHSHYSLQERSCNPDSVLRSKSISSWKPSPVYASRRYINRHNRSFFPRHSSVRVLLSSAGPGLGRLLPFCHVSPLFTTVLIITHYGR